MASESRSPAAPAALIAFFAGLCWFTIHRFSAWFDESYTLLLVGPHGMTDIMNRTALDGHPPLWYWVVKPWLSIFGANLFALRAQQTLFMLGALWVWFRFLELRFSRGVALLALALMVTNPMMLHYGVEGRMYAFSLLLVGLSSLAIASGWKWRWIAYWVCAVAMLYTHYFLAFVIAGHFVYLLLYRGAHGRSILWILLYGASIILPFGYWIPKAAHQTATIVGTGFWIPPVSPLSVLDYFEGTFLHHNNGELLGAVAFPALAVLAVIGAALLRAGRSRGESYALAWSVVVVPWVCLFLLSVGPLVPVFHPRYVIFGLPLLLALIAIGCLGVSPRWRIAMIATLIAGQLWGIHHMRWRGYTDLRGFWSMKQVAREVEKPIDGEVPTVVAPWLFTFFDARATLPASQRVVMLRDSKPRKHSTDAIYYDRPELWILSLDEIHAKHVWLLEENGGAVTPLPPGWHEDVVHVRGYCRMRLITVGPPAH